MSAATRERFARVVRGQPVDVGLACLLLAAETLPDSAVAQGQSHLNALASAARAQVDPAGSVQAQAEGLRVALGEHAGFAGFAEDYDDLRASLLPEVLARRRGLPILLSVVWVEVARRLGVPAYPVALPGHVVVGVGPPGGEPLLLDPFAGGRRISVHEAASRVRETRSAFSRALLAPADPVDLLMRVLTNIRLLGARTDEARTRLWAVELSLLLPRHPVALRRERGELLVRRGDFPGGAGELEAYADAVREVEPAVADAAQASARTARARLN